MRERAEGVRERGAEREGLRERVRERTRLNEERRREIARRSFFFTPQRCSFQGGEGEGGRQTDGGKGGGWGERGGVRGLPSVQEGRVPLASVCLTHKNVVLVGLRFFFWPAV